MVLWLTGFVCLSKQLEGVCRKWSSNIFCRNFCIFFRRCLDTLHRTKYVPQSKLLLKLEKVSHKSLSFSNKSRNILRSRWEIHSPWGPQCGDWQSVTDKNGVFPTGDISRFLPLRKIVLQKATKLLRILELSKKLGPSKVFLHNPERGVEGCWINYECFNGPRGLSSLGCSEWLIDGKASQFLCRLPFKCRPPGFGSILALTILSLLIG